MQAEIFGRVSFLHWGESAPAQSFPEITPAFPNPQALGSRMFLCAQLGSHCACSYLCRTQIANLVPGKILNENDRDQVLWARETEHCTQTFVFAKTAGSHNLVEVISYLRSSRPLSNTPYWKATRPWGRGWQIASGRVPICFSLNFRH